MTPGAKRYPRHFEAVVIYHQDPNDVKFMKDLDINKDNKISFEEFSKWWLSGRQGLSPLMRRLLGFKLKTTKLFGSI